VLGFHLAVGEGLWRWQGLDPARGFGEGLAADLHAGVGSGEACQPGVGSSEGLDGGKEAGGATSGGHYRALGRDAPW
jgi:hypothetical protein